MAFRTSSTCNNGACVEVDFRTASACASNGCVEVGFHKSTASSNGACVECGTCDACGDAGEPAWLMRDSKDQSGPVLTFSTSEWAEFITACRAGRYDPA